MNLLSKSYEAPPTIILLMASGLVLTLSVLCSVALLNTSSALSKIREDACVFYIPSTVASGSCVAYDLTKLASLPGVSFTSDYNYTLAVCGNVKNVPAVCSGKNPAPAYQYASADCYVIGQLQSPYVVSRPITVYGCTRLCALSWINCFMPFLSVPSSFLSGCSFL